MKFSTGLPELDGVLQGLRPGDNIVWQLASIEDYLSFVRPFCAAARARGARLVYFRFATHDELVPDDGSAEIHRLNPKDGFEQFITNIHRVIEQAGPGAYYVFDSYSELTVDCYSDRMLGNFFMLTCPYLYRLETVAYFAILRHRHSYHATQPIWKTTQVMLDVYNYRNQVYIHPLKVDGRFSPTLYMLHRREDDRFVPVRASATISEVLTAAPWPGLQSASYRMIGPWDQRFMQTEALIESQQRGECPAELVQRAFERLIPLLISRDQPVVELVKKYFRAEDFIHIWKRMIGTGMVGGKAVGMLLARAILQRTEPRWQTLLEHHDSFFIGSDVFYTFLVNNSCWLIRQKQKSRETFREDLDHARERIINGDFPDYIIKRFADMLDYYGQSPIIVRSSSLLEDNFGNAFAGKYESVFCPNRGTREERLEFFLQAVRVIYASAMSEEALTYRQKRGVLEQDEQMALLVQRVSGAQYGELFFPHLAGVGLSYNPYVWHEAIDPEAGMLRIVFGLGTRAVDRSDDDYTRIVALNAPDKRPAADFARVRQYAQKRIDVLNLQNNRHESCDFQVVVRQGDDLPLALFATLDRELERQLRQHKNRDLTPWVLTFDRIIATTALIGDMRQMLATLAREYGCPVEIEFAVNFFPDESYRINLLQCRPLQCRQDRCFQTLAGAAPVPEVGAGGLLLRAQGGVVGQSRIVRLDWLVYVAPEMYGALPEQQRYAVARLIGKLNRLFGQDEKKQVMLIGPGRWGTSMPSLGVPVSFAEINNVNVLCEVDTMHEGLVPDLSLGTHFFHEMVEMNMLYLAYFKAHAGNVFREDVIRRAPNRLVELLPEEGAWCDGVRVLAGSDLASAGESLHLVADAQKQTGLLYGGK